MFFEAGRKLEESYMNTGETDNNPCLGSTRGILELKLPPALKTEVFENLHEEPSKAVSGIEQKHILNKAGTYHHLCVHACMSVRQSKI